MSKKTNYLIGRAEQLTKIVPPPKSNFEKKYIYTVDELQERLLPKIDALEKEFKEMDQSKNPKNLAVTSIKLHPNYLSKSAFPSALLRKMGAYSIGSKSTSVQPDKWTKKGTPVESPSTEIFIAFQKENLKELKSEIEDLKDDAPLRDDIESIWDINLIDPVSKIKINEQGSTEFFEIGLHLVPVSKLSADIKETFINYAKSLGVILKTDLEFNISNLWFVPCKADTQTIKKLAEFAFVRVIRPVPQIRNYNPLVRDMPSFSGYSIIKQKPFNSDIRVAILDGGLPDSHDLEPWINNYRLSDSNALDCCSDHGLWVTSAYLFGPLVPGQQSARPFTNVDHYRVLDSDINNEEPLELYRTLGHIEDVLLSNQYEFINLSLGPDLPIDDDDVHPWTSVIDSYLASGNTFMTVAVGNNGERDSLAKLSRVQVPSDCINAIAVGACDRTGESWKKSSYSAIGPGRSPGRIKPDLVAFGGSPYEYFHVPHDNLRGQITPQCGTSFAAPNLLRLAAGIRAVMGENISILAIKALLVHTANQNGQSRDEVGWGKVPDHLSEIIESRDGTVKILYQGELTAGKYLNVPLPLPGDGLKGNVHITATCCISCDTDPQDASMYTKAGITIKWMPKYGSSKSSEQFFKQKTFATEAELRADAGKWESVLSNSKSKRASSLDEPAFELHYSARDKGGATSKGQPIKYAFVVTIQAPKSANIFNDILTEYQGILTEIEPMIDIPVQIRA